VTGPDLTGLIAAMPFAAAVGVELRSAGADEVVGVLAWAPERCTAAGVMHGGALITLADSVGALEPLTQGFLRANGYSLAATLGATVDSIESSGPGSYAGPLVSSVQALAVLVAFVAAFAALSGYLLRRRDVE